MTTLREAAAAALEALYCGEAPPNAKQQTAAEVLRAALAEFDAEPTKEGHTQTDSKQEPVANHSEDDLDMVKCRQIAREYAWPNSNIDSGNLYWALHVALRHAAPPQRQPLTDEEIEDAYRRYEETRFLAASAWSFEVGVRWAERAHGIGGQDDTR